MDKKPFAILFAGPIGSFKSTIANHLSVNLGLPIFNRDIIRREVRVDLGRVDAEELERRSEARLQGLISRKMSFIYDASIDRKWEKSIRELASKEGYATFIISMDFSKEFMQEKYDVSGYIPSEGETDRVYAEHQKFLEKYGNDVNLHITDEDFEKKFEMALNAINEWLKNRDASVA